MESRVLRLVSALTLAAAFAVVPAPGRAQVERQRIGVVPMNDTAARYWVLARRLDGLLAPRLDTTRFRRLAAVDLREVQQRQLAQLFERAEDTRPFTIDDLDRFGRLMRLGTVVGLALHRSDRRWHACAILVHPREAEWPVSMCAASPTSEVAAVELLVPQLDSALRAKGQPQLRDGPS